MKKNYLYVAMFTLVALFATSCEKVTTEGLTRITYYPTITVLGDAETVVNVGETYTDAGCSAMLNGEDVTEQVVVSSDVDTDAMGIYTVKYSVTNEDGFSSSASRTVYVVNSGNFNNLYWGESQFGSRHYYNAPICISDNGDGTYQIDDILGGFYFNGRYPGYEPTYDFHAEADVTLEADNTITLLGVGSWYFESEPLAIVTGTFDSTTGTVSLELDFAGDPFYVTLTPITKN